MAPSILRFGHAEETAPGIDWDESRGKCRASIYESGKRYRLGRFDTLIDAKASLAIARTDVARAISVPRLRAARKRSAQWRKLRVLK